MRAAIVFGALAGGYGLFVWLVIDPRLIYYGYGLSTVDGAFARSMASLAEFLRYPGGLAQFASSRLAQLFYYSGLGALILTAVACLLCVLTDIFVRAVGGERLRGAALVPAIFVLLLFGRYSNHLTGLLGLLGALAFLSLYIHLPVRGGAVRLLGLLALAALLYYAAAGACLLFLVLCGLFELSARRSLLGSTVLVLAMLYGVLGLLVPYAADTRLLDLSVYQACGRVLPFHSESDIAARPLALALWLYLPVAGAAMLLWARIARQVRPAEAGRAFLYQSLALGLIAVVGFSVAFNRAGRRLVRLHAAAETGQWTEVLQQAQRLPPTLYNAGIYWDVCRALYHAGRLPSDMFFYPQGPLGIEALLVEIERLATPPIQLMKLSTLAYELGLMNLSERLAYEAIELLGERPEIFQRLALIASVKGQSELARTYLHALSKDPIYRGWAHERLERLERDPSFSSDVQIQQLRAAMMPEDHIIGWHDAEGTLKELLKSPGGNRMAYEFLMAHYLLKGQLEKLVAALDGLERYGYSQMPKLYEEAALLYITTTGRLEALHGRKISAATRGRLDQFQRVLAQYEGRERAARAALAHPFGSSYFYYYCFYAPKESGG